MHEPGKRMRAGRSGDGTLHPPGAGSAARAQSPHEQPLAVFFYYCTTTSSRKNQKITDATT